MTEQVIKDTRPKANDSYLMKAIQSVKLSKFHITLYTMSNPR